MHHRFADFDTGGKTVDQHAPDLAFQNRKPQAGGRVLSGKHVSLLWRMNRGFHTPEPPWDI